MYVGDFASGPGQIGGPPNPNAYKRAVYHHAPPKFSVEVLPPIKQSTAYSYGMRISPLKSSSQSSSSSSSASTSSSNREYEIWRRWEDLLWFQDTLELEYSIRSRQKRSRLLAGKGVKRTNGTYIHSDLAASFESLPPGPDPRSIAKNVHDYLPKLTKKGTLFRASMATVEQRQREFQSLMDALWAEEVPMLVKEVRETSVVRDFFGYWRRDRDYAVKARKEAGKGGETASRSSFYFSPSTLSLQQGSGRPSTAGGEVPPTPPIPEGILKSTSASGSGTQTHNRSKTLSPTGVTFTLDNRSNSNQSSSSASTSSAESRKGKGRMRSESTPVRFNPPPTQPDGEFGPEFTVSLESERSLGVLPEDRELGEGEGEGEIEEVPRAVVGVAVSPESTTYSIRRRTRTLSAQETSNRNCVVLDHLLSPPPVPSLPPQRESLDSTIPESEMTSTLSSSTASGVFSTPSSRRSSWQTSVSDIPPRPASEGSYASCVDLEMVLGVGQGQGEREEFGFLLDAEKKERRASVGSTDSALDPLMANLNLNLGYQQQQQDAYALRRSLSAGSRVRRLSAPISVLEEEPWSEGEGEGEGEGDLIETYFEGSVPPLSPRWDGDADSDWRPDSFSGPDTPGPSTPRFREQISAQLASPDSFPKPFQHRPPGQFHIPWSSRRSSTTSTSTSDFSDSTQLNVGAETFTVKAALRDVIILLRTRRSTGLDEMKRKLAEKFRMQEGIELGGGFTLAYTPTTDATGRRGTGRARSSSVSSVGVVDPTQLRYIFSQHEWDLAIATCGGKLTLRIIE